MEKLNNEKDFQENASLGEDLDTSFEVKESIFEKIKSALTRPRLGPGNNIKTTTMSFNSWSIRATFRRALEAVSNGMTNLMKRKEPEIKNGFSTIVIGTEENHQDQQLRNNEKIATQTKDIFIPGKIPGLKSTAKAPNAPDLLVGNVATKTPDSLQVEDMNVEDINLPKKTPLQDTKETNKQQDKQKDTHIKPEIVDIATSETEKTDDDRIF